MQINLRAPPETLKASKIVRFDLVLEKERSSNLAELDKYLPILAILNENYPCILDVKKEQT